MNYGLILDKGDFRAITTQPMALRKLRLHLIKYKKYQEDKSSPATMDELFHKFLVNEKRRDYKGEFEKRSSSLVSKSLSHLTYD